MKSYMTQRLDEYRDGNEDKGRLLVSCPDQPGIVSAVSAFLFEHGANIIESNQYTTDPEGGRFFLRIEFDCAGIREKIITSGSVCLCCGKIRHDMELNFGERTEACRHFRFKGAPLPA